MELWEVAKKGVGKPPAFNSPEEMKERAFEYFSWLKENQLHEQKPFSSQGEVIYGDVFKMRPATQQGLCVFLNIGVSTWHDYKKKDGYSEVISIIESVMYEQKFSGAAAGLLNANIIARDLGLKETTETQHSGHMHQIQHNTQDYQKAQELLKSEFNGLD